MSELTTQSEPITQAEYQSLIRRIKRCENHIAAIALRFNITTKPQGASPRRSNRLSARETVFDCLDIHGKSLGLTAKEVQKHTGLPFNSVAATLQALRKDGLVVSESGWPDYKREFRYYLATYRIENGTKRTN